MELFQKKTCQKLFIFKNSNSRQKSHASDYLGLDKINKKVLLQSRQLYAIMNFVETKQVNFRIRK